MLLANIITLISYNAVVFLGSYNTLEVDDLLEVNQGELMRYVLTDVISGGVACFVCLISLSTYSLHLKHFCFANQ